MLFVAKTALPGPTSVLARYLAPTWLSTDSITLFSAPAGYLLAESLASFAADQQRPIVWLRVGPEDRDPATLLLMLIAAARQLHPEAGAATLEQMRRSPGPTAGWTGLFAGLAADLAATLPVTTLLVCEQIDALCDAQPTLSLLGRQLLAALPAEMTCLLIATGDVPREALPATIIERGGAEVRLSVAAALALADAARLNLTAAAIRRAVALTQGRAEALAGLFAAGQRLGPGLLEQTLTRADGGDDLLARIATAWLAQADTGARQAAALALHLEYSHADLNATALGRAGPLGEPWLLPLAGGWFHLRPAWRAPLRLALRSAARPALDALRRAADYLVAQGALLQAVPLYLELDDYDRAAVIIAGVVDTMMNLGQWQTLDAWLARLPAPVLRAWPWLAYAHGEIAAAQGDTEAARRRFSVATAAFSVGSDAAGACQSLLAESALSAWVGNRGQAQALAQAAGVRAEAAGLAWHHGWAAWQQGCLAATEGDFETALIYLERALSVAETIGEATMVELLRRLEEVLARRRELGAQREFYRQAQVAAEQALAAIGARLHELLSTPPAELERLLKVHGWAHTPLPLKLPAPAPAELAAPPAARSGLWGGLLGALGLRRRAPAQLTLPDPSPAPQTRVVMTADNFPLLVTPIPPGAPPAPGDPALVLIGPATPISAAGPAVGPTLNLERQAAPAEPAAGPTLTAYLLGQFRAMLNDQPVENWPSSRGRAIFKYLLTHRDRPAPRDVLMDLFWPDSGPEEARNSLNVALHGLRQALRSAAAVPVVEFCRDEGAYRLHPNLHLWLDVDEFERHVQAGCAMEAAGQFAAAAAGYEVAAGLYQGDFLADDPYEEWPVLHRERLRLAYLDTLDRLGRIYFSQGRYAACATLCQLLLARDNCREDAHCRLMRCYSRQGQRHLALRQYQVCVRALHDDLGVAPAPATTDLCERIRRREWV